MPVSVVARFLAGVLRRVPAQTRREAVTTASLRFAMSEAMRAGVKSLKMEVLRVAIGGSTSGAQIWAAE